VIVASWPQQWQRQSGPKSRPLPDGCNLISHLISSHLYSKELVHKIKTVFTLADDPAEGVIVSNNKMASQSFNLHFGLST